MRTQDTCHRGEPSTCSQCIQSTNLSCVSLMEPRSPAPATLSPGLASRSSTIWPSPPLPESPTSSPRHTPSPPRQVELRPQHTSLASTCPLCPAVPSLPHALLPLSRLQTLQKSHFLHPCVNKYLRCIYCVPDT